MFTNLLIACSELEKAQPKTSEIPEDILQLVPAGITAQDVRGMLSTDDSTESRIVVIRAAYAALSTIAQAVTDGQSNEKNDAETLTEIADRITKIIVPVCAGASLDHDSTDYATLSRLGELGLRALDQLAQIFPSPLPLSLPSSTLLRITAFTSPADPWTTAASCTLSPRLLSHFLETQPQPQRTQLIVDEILTKFLRPLFSKSRPSAVTASGRKAEFAEPGRRDPAADRETPEAKPWKYAHRYAITVFAWAVRQADPLLLQTHWPLYTPALLTLLDDPDLRTRTRGLVLLRSFWARCPAGLMQETGLADVFEAAVFPALSYLPTLTPEGESLELLREAYPVLIEMAGLEYMATAASGGDDATTGGAGLPVKGDKSKEEKGEEKEAKSRQITERERKLLDKIVREGLLMGYHHAKEHVRLVGLFCETLTCIVNGMGILAVKHLKELIPMVSEILTDPFGTKHPPTLSSAILLLQAILRACWPRIPRYCNEIVKMLMLSWLNIADEESFQPDDDNANALKAKLAETADMLSAVMKAAHVDLSERVMPLIEKEPQLDNLFNRNKNYP